MRIELSSDQISVLNALVDELTAEFRSVEEQGFADRAALLSGELPRSLRRQILDFRLHEPEDGLCLISGIPIEDDEIGPTPSHWRHRPQPSPTLRQECAFFLLAELLGEPIAWRTQQSGYLMHDILPVQGHEGEQLGTGSEELLWWHTEDAFHPYRGDYLGMLCLRNPDRVPTTVCAVADLDLDAEQLRLLFGKHFTIRPDESHLPKNCAGKVDDELRSSYSAIEQMWHRPQRLAVLFGDPAAPYVRLDPYFMDPVEEPAPRRALQSLVAAIDDNLRDLALSPGEVCFFDNYQVVHGRKPFKARYDGSDRWMKRLNIVRDLRKSRAVRSDAASRVIG